MWGGRRVRCTHKEHRGDGAWPTAEYGAVRRGTAWYGAVQQGTARYVKGQKSRQAIQQDFQIA